MKLSNDIKGFYGKFFGATQKKAVPLSRSAKTLLHWKIIVISFLVAVLLIFAYSYFFYDDVVSGDLPQNDKKVTAKSAQTLSKQLGAVVNYFEVKGGTFQIFRNDRSVLPDPSL
ncbi:MAG: hypothetical protein V4467_03250 [Patescibacteria group bacterium]